MLIIYKKYKSKDTLAPITQNCILHNCNYTSNIPSNMPEYMKKEKSKSNKNMCFFNIYTNIRWNAETYN